MWKERGINKYPEIILSDCSILNIDVREENIEVNFDEYGFFIKDKKSNKYYRTGLAQIKIKKCDIDNIEIKEIRTQQLSEDLYFNSAYEVKIKDFLDRINTGKWKFEIVEEFYATRSALYIGMIRENGKTFWLYVKLQFEELIYLWNEIRYDRPW